MTVVAVTSGLLAGGRGAVDATFAVVVAVLVKGIVVAVVVDMVLAVVRQVLDRVGGVVDCVEAVEVGGVSVSGAAAARNAVVDAGGLECPVLAVIVAVVAPVVIRSVSLVVAVVVLDVAGYVVAVAAGLVARAVAPAADDCTRASAAVAAASRTHLQYRKRKERLRLVEPGRPEGPA